MKISGFTLVKNGVRFDYPFLESIRSLLPLVDELVINVGKSEDGTLERIREFERSEGLGKIRVLEHDWDAVPNASAGLSDLTGVAEHVLARQTNLALDRCTGEWCVYLQADEILHEEDIGALRRLLLRHRDDPHIDGIVLNYVHFYGSFDVIQQSRSAYRREVRIIRSRRGIRSVGDAQSFRRGDGQKPNVILSRSRIFHYGWVRPPEIMREKTFHMDELYHGKATPEQRASGLPHTGDNHRYKKFWGLKKFKGSHPAVMQERVRRKNWNWDFESARAEWEWKDFKKVALDSFEKITGIRLFEYKSYRIIGNE